MNPEKIGKLIFTSRTKKGMTQSQLAEKINVSDKTVSKWECGNGCPDITLISDIAKVLELDISSLLCGELKQNIISGGNMKNIKFYICKSCKNTVTSTNPVQLDHEMTEENYIAGIFAEQELAFVTNQVEAADFYAVDCNGNGFKLYFE